MIYTSTRDKSRKEFFSATVKAGLSKEGGLFVPSESRL